MKGARKRLEREHNERAWQAWTTAMLPLTEKRPRYESLLFSDKPAKPRTWEDEFARFSAWAGEAVH